MGGVDSFGYSARYAETLKKVFHAADKVKTGQSDGIATRQELKQYLKEKGLGVDDVSATQDLITNYDKYNQRLTAKEQTACLRADGLSGVEVDQYISDLKKKTYINIGGPKPGLMPSAEDVPKASEEDDEPTPTPTDLGDEKSTLGVDAFANSPQQGQIGDCFLVASIHAVKTNPKLGKKALAKMIKPISGQIDMEGTKNFYSKYEVTFPGFPDEPITVDLLKDMRPKQVQKAGIGDRVLEIAYGKLSKKKGWTEGKDEPSLSDALDSISDGGYSGHAMYALTGKKTEYHSGFPDDVYSEAAKDPSRYLLVASSKNTKEETGNFIPNHAYTMLPDPSNKNQMLLVNPWDPERIQKVVTRDDFKKYFDAFTVTDLSQTGSPSDL